VSLAEASRRLGHRVHALGIVDSTQTEAVRLAEAGAAEGTVVTASHQTSGRGRRGRRWVDAGGESLLMSIVLRPPVSPNRAPQLSLVGAVAVADALRACAGVRAAIRWPNDVMVGERKICGMLPEAATPRPGALGHVVLGIGLNVNQAEFPAPLCDLATSVRIETGRMTAIGEILEACFLPSIGGMDGSSPPAWTASEKRGSSGRRVSGAARGRRTDGKAWRWTSGATARSCSARTAARPSVCSRET